MTRSAERLYDLLPVIHRMRDAERGYPLRALLSVIGEQVNVIEDDIAQLYANWFIETCADWAVPYIGDLIGYRPVHEAGIAGDAAAAEGRQLNKILTPRREVANTLGYRRRKGTLALLELLANTAAGWPARAVEFYSLLGWTQHFNHLRLGRGRSADLRLGEALDLIDGPLDRLAHTADIRRVNSQRAQGCYNVPSVGVFVWRLKTYSISHAPAYCVESEAPHCFTFSALGNDTPLNNKAEPETEPTHIAEAANLPVPVRRRALEEVVKLRPRKTEAAAAYYGKARSIAIYAPGWPAKDADASQPVPRGLVVPADLSDWRYRAKRGEVALDPVLGRIVFPQRHLPKRGVWVDYHYAFSADMGGGEYDRALSQPAVFTLYRVSKETSAEGLFSTVNAALAKWREAQKSLRPRPSGDDPALPGWLSDKEKLRAAVIEVLDSAAYTEQLAIVLEAGEYLQIRAANRVRPVIRLLDYMTDRPDAFSLSGKQGSRFTLDGLIVTGRGLQITGPDRGDAEAVAQGDVCDVTIRHSTLVPGWGLDCDCEPKRPSEPSLELTDTAARIVIEHSIIGSIHVTADETQTDPVEIAVSDSIIDATSVERAAVCAPNLPLAFAKISFARCTVIGGVETHAIPLAENSIFMAPVCVGRRQIGCMRFCYVTPVSRTPRRYHCEPDAALRAVKDAIPEAAMDREAARVRPRFTSLRYGAPAYCQLSRACAGEITRGASDEAEMGAFHDLFQPQREANLRARLIEFTPAGMDAGILFAN